MIRVLVAFWGTALLSLNCLAIDIKDISITYDAKEVSGCHSLGEIATRQKGKSQKIQKCPSPENYLSRIVKSRKGNTLLIRSFSDPCRVETYQAQAYYCKKDKGIAIPMH